MSESRSPQGSKTMPGFIGVLRTHSCADLPMLSLRMGTDECGPVLGIASSKAPVSIPLAEFVQA